MYRSHLKCFIAILLFHYCHICLHSTYLLRDGIFKSWIRFAIGWLVISYLWIVMTPHNTGFALGIDQKPVTALSLAILFSVLSFILILIRIVQVYKLNK